jgi:hypothetical protein
MAKVITYFYQGHEKDGEGNKVSLTSREDGKTAAAKTVFFENSKRVDYYIKHFNGQLFDAYDRDMARMRANSFSYRKVQKQAFEHYTTYLRNASASAYKRAGRLM